MPLDRLIRKSRPTVRAEVLPRVKCIVVDEVDRLVDVLSKHAPPKEVEKRKRHARPIAALLERALQSSPDVQVKMRRFTFSVNPYLFVVIYWYILMVLLYFQAV